MDRHLLATLIDWINSKHRKPLVLRGARQVGKSTLVRMLAKATERPLVEINLEQHSDLDPVFQKLDIEKCLNAIEQRLRLDIPENALLFLDEIQDTPHAFAALRYFYENAPSIAVIAAGSLLELMLGEVSFSIPVGRIQYLHVEPMTFDEFLLALKENWFLEKLQAYALGDEWSDDLHEHGSKLLRQFMLTGGMPEAISTFVENPTQNVWRSIQRQIVDTYREDFRKYTNRQALIPVIQDMYMRIPRSIGKKIKYQEIAPGIRHEYSRNALKMLSEARIVRLAMHTDGTGIPLDSEVRQDISKAFWIDVGLLNRLLGLDLDVLDATKKLAQEGVLAEQFIAQHLSVWAGSDTNPALHYWLRDGRKGNAEVDFLLQHKDLIIPVEIKASASGSLRSLLQFLTRGKSNFGIKFDLAKPSLMQIRHKVLTSDGSKDVNAELLTLPHYMVCQLQRLLNQRFRSK